MTRRWAWTGSLATEAPVSRQPSEVDCTCGKREEAELDSISKRMYTARLKNVLWWISLRQGVHLEQAGGATFVVHPQRRCLC